LCKLQPTDDFVYIAGLASLSSVTAEWNCCCWAARREKISDQVVIGTHGRLHQWMNRRLLPARHLKILVFDEADEMLKVSGGACAISRYLHVFRNAAACDIFGGLAAEAAHCSTSTDSHRSRGARDTYIDPQP